MADINEKRAYVTALYKGERWRVKVMHMSDIQVIAIYLREKKKAAEGGPPKPDKEDEDEFPF